MSKRKCYLKQVLKWIWFLEWRLTLNHRLRSQKQRKSLPKDKRFLKLNLSVVLDSHSIEFAERYNQIIWDSTKFRNFLLSTQKIRASMRRKSRSCENRASINSIEYLLDPLLKYKLEKRSNQVSSMLVICRLSSRSLRWESTLSSSGVLFASDFRDPRGWVNSIQQEKYFNLSDGKKQRLRILWIRRCQERTNRR